MRLYCALLGLGLLAAGDASASSFVTVAPPASGKSSSIVMLGTPAPAPAVVAGGDIPLPPLAYPEPSGSPAPAFPPHGTRVSQSIVAMGEPAPFAEDAIPVAQETVAAIPEAAPPPPLQDAPVLTVIRGGIVGGNFAPAQAAPARPADVARGGALPPGAVEPSEPEAPGEPEAPQPAVPPAMMRQPE